MTNRSGLQRRLRSFHYAARGVVLMLRTQANARIHAAATAGAVAAGVWFGIGRIEWACIVLAIVSVWTSEAVNTAFEFLADVASPEFHPLIEKGKDVAAGAVLICAVGSVVIGLLILGPHFIALRNASAP